MTPFPAIAIGPADLKTWFGGPQALELAGILAALALCAFLPGRALAFARPVWRVVDRLAARPPLAIAAVGGLSLAGSALSGVLVHLPEPAVHDEFSYMLAADTFASGRLTNPPHRHWQHFETLHVLSQPTYMSKYPPGQGLVLALGLVTTGDAIAGVWLSTAAACAALCWMLYGWVPPRWALAGGAIAALRFGIAGYWAQSYWGGSLAFLGGALAWGALPRLLREPRVPTALALGAGLAVLSNSRPFEGVLASLPIAAILAWRFARNPRPFSRRAWIARAALPVALVLAADAAWIGVYNRAVTGSATTLPYFVHQRQYAKISPFLWGTPPSPPAYRHEEMRRYYEDEERPFLMRQKNPAKLAGEILWKLWRTVDFPWGNLAFVALAFALPVWRRRRTRPAVWALGFCALGFAGLTIMLPHYAAPIGAALALVLVQGLRHLAACRAGGRRWGRLAVLAILLPLAGTLAGRLAAMRGGGDAFGVLRADHQSALEDMGGDHLVFVRYGPRHFVHQEWVYNRADIDRARVVWARDMGPEKNAELRRDFAGRRAWTLTVNAVDEPPLLLELTGR